MYSNSNLTSRNNRFRTAAATLTLLLEPPTQIVFIDRQLADYDILAAGVLPDLEVCLLDSERDGVQQITQVLATRRSIDTIHLVSHGSAGRIQLGSGDLSVESIAKYSLELQQWSERLAPGAELVIYGCEVGKGDRGIALVYRLSELLGASVAAAETKTGNAAVGADWELGIRTGKQPVQLAFTADAMATYQGVMPTVPGTPGNDDLKGDNNLLTPRLDDSIDGLAGDDTINSGLGVDTVDGGADNDLLIADYSSSTFNGANGVAGGLVSTITQNGNSFSGNFRVATGGDNKADGVTFSNIERFQVTGTNFNDTFNGALVGGIDAGDGIDTLHDADYSRFTADVNVNESGNLLIPDGTTIKNVERFDNITTGTGKDTINLASRHNEIINTGAGDDTINSGLGVDTVDGGADNDLLIADYSSSTFNGANGVAGGLVSSITQNGNSFSGSFRVATGGDNKADGVTFSNIERFQVTGTKFNDSIQTYSGNDTIIGGGGADTLMGGDGNDLYLIDRTLGAGTVVDDSFGANDTIDLGVGANYTTANLSRDGKTLLVDLNKDGVFNAANDLSIKNFFASTTGSSKAGNGYIENVANLSGSTILDFYSRPVITGFPKGTTGSNKGSTTMVIAGENFSPNTQIGLLDGSGGTKTPSKVYWVSDKEIWATFDLQGLAVGNYGISVKNDANTAVTNNSFFVTDGDIGSIQTSFSYNASGVATLKYTNVGQTDVAAPLFRLNLVNASVSGGEGGGIGVLDLDEIERQKLFGSIIGTSNNGPAGILAAGESGEISFDYLPKGTGLISIAVEPIPADEVIDWGRIKTAERKDSTHIDETAWDTIWATFTAAVGSTFGQFQAAIAQDINHFSQLGQKIDNIDSLFRYEISKADNGLSESALLGTVDAFDNTPGLPLQLSRTFYQSTAERYNLGIFGRGWNSGWETHLTKDPKGNVFIRSTGDLRSFFARQSDGTFTNSSSNSKFTVVSGEYQLQDVDGSITVFSNDGKLKLAKDTNGNQITLQYTNNLLSKLAHSSGDTLDLTYNAQGRVSKVTDSTGKNVTYSYDVAGEHLLSVTDSSGTATYTYDTSNDPNKKHSLLSITSDLGYQHNYNYDSRGRLSKEYTQDPATSVSYSYNEFGDVTATNANGVSGTVLLNLDGTIGQIREANNQNTLLKYDDNGNPILVTNGKGEFTQTTYDSKNNLIGQTTSSAQNLKFTYDPTFNGLTGFTDSKGNGVNYGYDSKGNGVKTAYANGSTQQLEVDSLGNVTSSVNRRGEKIAYQVNKDGHVIQKQYTDGSQVAYAYDTKGNLVSATDATGTITLEYDGVDQFSRITYPNGRSLQYTYNADGQRTSIVTQDGHQTNYSYDTLGRLKSLTNGAGQNIITYDYDAVGRLVKETNGNGTSSVYTYDSSNQLTSLIHYKADASINSSFVYAYNDLGQRTSMITTAGTFTYDYDKIGQLVSVSTPDSRVIQYRYDAAGNRTLVTTNSGVSTTYVSDNLNEYTSIGNDSYTYDRDGNLTSKISNGQTSTYTYDAENKLTRVVTPTGTWDYQYDALGNRVASTLNGQRTEYLIDPTGLGDIVGEYNSSGLVAHYDYGSGLVSRVGSGVNYYDADGTGSTIGLTSNDGTYVNRYSYLPFGESISKVEGVANPFEYVGQFGVVDEGNGLNLMRARFYDPALGRFTTNDPLGFNGGDTNFYRYAGNNPVSYIDPSGERRHPAEVAIDAYNKGKSAYDKVNTITGAWEDLHTLAGDPLKLLVQKLPGGEYKYIILATAKAGTVLANDRQSIYKEYDISSGLEWPPKIDLTALEPAQKQLKKSLDYVDRARGTFFPIMQDFGGFVGDGIAKNGYKIYTTLDDVIHPYKPIIPFQDAFLEDAIKRKKPPKPDSGSDGDPHFTTLDGAYYNFQGVGEFTLVKSTTDDLEIQVRQTKVSSGASVNTAIAFQSGGQKVEFDAGQNQVILNGVATDIPDKSLFAVGTNLVIAREGKRYNIYTANNDLIQIDNNVSYFDIGVGLADNRQGKVAGLLGNNNNNSNDDFALRDGTVIGNTVADAQLSANSWRITQATSLFTYAPGTDTTTFTDTTPPVPVVITPAQRAAAELTARNAGITDPNLLENAIFDLVVTNDPAYLETYKTAQRQITVNAPNSSINPDGTGNQFWVAANAFLPNTIRFTNTAAAGTTPVAKVTVSQQLDADLNLDTFSFDDIVFGGNTIQIPAGAKSFSQRLDLQSTQGVLVDVTADLDTTTRIVTWTFNAIDPASGLPANIATKGFLPPNDVISSGVGTVGYTIQPKLGSPNNTRIDAQASIRFNNGDAIQTTAVFNTLDLTLPTSSVNALAANNPNNFNVAWAGSDSDSGIASYNIFVSIDGGKYSLWKTNTTATSATYTGQPGRTYAFYSIGVDGSNNVEAAPLQADATTQVIAAVNQPPTGAPTKILANTLEDTAITINAIDLLAGFSDPNSDILSITNLVATNGTLVNNNNGTYQFTPTANFNGAVNLTYSVTDGTNILAGQARTFNVTPVNDPPTGAPTKTLADTLEGTAITINAIDLLAGFSDVDTGDILSITNLIATNGTLVNNNNGTYKFTPTATFNGVVNLTYDVTDGTATLPGQTRSFNVTPLPVISLPVISLSVTDADAAETLAGQPANPGQFTLTRTGATTADLTVNYTIAGTATNGVDDEKLTGTATFKAGSSTATIDVKPNDDNIYEGTETVIISLLADPAYIIPAAPSPSLNITDNDTKPTISVANISQPEGNSGNTNYGFNLTLSNPSTETITVKYTTANDTATAVSDYTAATGVVTFNPGEITKIVNVVATGDTLFEADETFKLNLSDPVNATIMTTLATGSIINDDVVIPPVEPPVVPPVEPPVLPEPVVICISDAYPKYGKEGDPDAAHREFDIYLSHASIETITVEYATVDGTAIGDSDFDPIAPTTLTFAPGETCKTISVAILDDNVYEQKESFIVELTNATNATIELGSDYGIAKIIDDDLPGISIDCTDKEAAEIKAGKSNSGKFSFKRTGSTTDALEVNYTIEGSAINGTDYITVDDSITFAAGIDTSTIEINPIYDGISEGTESITLKLSDSDNYTVVGDKSETANITDLVLPLVLPIKNIDEFKNPVGTGFQGKPEGEVIDCRGFAGQNLKVDTVSVGDAAYQNYIGWYAVEDAQGTLANGLKVGDVGYAEAAIKSAILRSFKIETQSDRTVTGGKIFAPVVIANGTFDEFLNRNPQNQADSNIHAYFNYLGANTDKVDHFRLLGDNKFGVEDMYGGGDRDYNDIVIQINVKS